MKILKDNIYNLNLLDIIKTQDLTIDFIAKYILNKDYHLKKEEMDKLGTPNNLGIKFLPCIVHSTDDVKKSDIPCINDTPIIKHPNHTIPLKSLLNKEVMIINTAINTGYNSIKST